MSRDRAVKLKFEISAEDHDRLRTIFFVPDAENVEKSRALRVYLDTPDALLYAQDLTWCFSRKDKIRDGRLKIGEWRLDGESDSRSFVKKHRLRNFIGGAFTARVDRERILHRAAEAVIEIGLEQTSLRNGDQAAVLSEAQFTLLEGETEALERFVSEVLPQAVPAPVANSIVGRGYALTTAASGLPSAAPQGSAATKLDKDMPVAGAFGLIARAEIDRAFAAPPPQDAASLQQNIQAVRRIQGSFRFFAKSFDGETLGLDLRPLAQFEAALERAYDLDRILTGYLRPAAQRGRWDGASSLVARIDEGRTRAFVILAQTWPAARVKNLFATVSDWLSTRVQTSAAGAETLSSFLSRELAEALDEVQVLGAALDRTGIGKARAEDLHPLAEAVARLQEVVGFFEPLASGKAASKRWMALQEALGGLKALLDTEYQLAYAQALVADAASHIARMKQTKTQIAHLYAAGALAGFVEALKEEGPEKALRRALSALSEVKPFWAKID